MLSKKDILILQEIIDLKGHCLFSTRCVECPFRSNCLPEFLNTVPPTQSQRMNMALDVIAYQELLGDDTLA